jgi:triacylglycerol lipase
MDHLQHASLMAKMAGIAYLDGKEAKAKYKKLGFTGHMFFDNDGAQCHAVWNKDMYVLCFRGTEPDEFSDIKADLNALPDRAHNGNGLVHNGFQEELNKIWGQVHNHYNKTGIGKSFFICGHSLGGAMATLAASRFTKVDCLYTYGSPRAGTRKFVKSITCKHYRHVNNNDIVPKVPFAFLGYRHHGELRYINFYGNIRKMTYWQRVKDGWRGRMAAWKNKQPFDGARDHSMDNYIKYLGDE